ncbi:MAG TPA: hypothetical protein PLD75_03430 [Spirochaetota bacterium]|nr:hypothetical protein [Spirochaetota bacterium]
MKIGEILFLGNKKCRHFLRLIFLVKKDYNNFITIVVYCLVEWGGIAFKVGQFSAFLLIFNICYFQK